jgi:hypothetical protein
MIILKNCQKYISNGILLRIILTIVSFNILYILREKNLYLILPILLTVLDTFDNAFLLPKIIAKLQLTNCTIKCLYYQISDKICDIFSYVLCYVYFYDVIKDPLLELFILYRLIGILLYISTNNKYYLVIFFDLIKEYMLYKYFLGKNLLYLPLVIILKICFEYVLHLHINKDAI